jgi:hypothetical protein
MKLSIAEAGNLGPHPTANYGTLTLRPKGSCELFNIQFIP